MKKLIFLALVLLGSVPPSFSLAAETAESQIAADRLLDAYVQCMNAKDWEMAEIIALGAKAKFGEQHAMVRRMLSEVNKGIASEKLVVGQTLFYPLTLSTRPQPPRPVVTNVNYPLEDQLTETGDRGRAQVIAICDRLRVEIDKQDWPLGEIEVGPFMMNRSLIVVATEERHQFVQEFLAKLTRNKQEEMPSATTR